MRLSGWGRFPRAECRTLTARSAGDAVRAVAEPGGLIARGNGRSYGDAALNSRLTLSMRGMDRMLAFDPDSGTLTCEAGVLLSDILDAFVPRGWFPPVTPGTKLVTVGGMIAADVHGKNHHGAGSFGDHVVSLDLLLADGRIVTCGPGREPELFAATRGGMGLTGVILRASVRLIPVTTAYVRQETLRADDLDGIMGMFEESGGWTYSVAWIDCLARGARLGRSLMFRGEHAGVDELPQELRSDPLSCRQRRPLTVPLDFPGFVLNNWTVGAFNELYWRRGTPRETVVDYDTFFYPLDALLQWNRIYGRSGFFQYQCVLPKAVSAAGLRSLLETIASTGNASFLAVLKLFGRQEGVLSFPMEGYTLALDFPANAASMNLMLALDRIVADHGGRLYLAKDARMGTSLLRQGYPALENFKALRGAHRLEGTFRSLQSERLGL
ncbi:FAD-binding oxidoreductase [Azospirillum sp. SYSU D00513]|uniref:FAD-binding oxidoreductase n=1 Tax=Azospirillum sp. SYSU D00513 TaxID=2812561 RepID=UPI001A977AAA|nr:FAD-binding oxidoreductase [Azospirillum sp. SYSU D00513]